MIFRDEQIQGNDAGTFVWCCSYEPYNDHCLRKARQTMVGVISPPIKEYQCFSSGEADQLQTVSLKIYGENLISFMKPECAANKQNIVSVIR